MSQKPPSRNGRALVLALASLFALAPSLGAQDQASAPRLRAWERIWNTVKARYLDPSFGGVAWDESLKRRIDAAITAGMDEAAFTALMSGTLDLLPEGTACYRDPAESAAYLKEREGQGAETVGIGVFLLADRRLSCAVVTHLASGGPAQRGGIQPGDRIIAADSVPIVSQAGDLRMDRLRGPAGTWVTVSVQTRGQERKDIRIARERVVFLFPSVSGRLLHPPGMPGKSLAYLRLDRLDREDSADDLRRALSALAAEARLDGIILDLRLNGNSVSIDQMASACGVFMRGPLLRIKDQFGSRTHSEATGAEVGGSRSLPLAVLVGAVSDQGPGMLAGILKKAGRGRLVGQRSFFSSMSGQRFTLPNGGDLEIMTETMVYPDGSPTGWDDPGLVPDLEIPGGPADVFDEARDMVLAAAIHQLLGP